MLTVERLREVLHYEPATGVFTWQVRLGHQGPVGSRAGSIYANGRRYIAIDKRRHFASRLAWLFVHGRWPIGQIDHVNCVRNDDRIDNLREATPAQNIANRSVTKRSHTGIKGVGHHGRGYRARIRVNDTLIALGTFKTPERASEAYADAARQHYGEFARTA